MADPKARFKATFDKIGRAQGPIVHDFEATDWNDLAEQMYQYADTFLASSDTGLTFDADKMNGVVVAGMRTVGAFTVEALGPVPEVA